MSGTNGTNGTNQHLAVEAIVTTPDATISGAAKLMREYDVSAVLVLDPHDAHTCRSVEVVTDRDLVVEVTALELDPDAITVGDLVNNGLTARRGASRLRDLVHGMRSRGVERIPVSRGGRVTGVLMIEELLEIVR